LHVLLLFLLVQGTFTHKDVREHLAPLLGINPSQLTPGRITYDLRRLRLHSLTERIPKTHRYRIMSISTVMTGLSDRVVTAPCCADLLRFHSWIVLRRMRAARRAVGQRHSVVTQSETGCANVLQIAGA
jgi:hypothetical protein